MGANMARRLKECGYAVTAVYDTRPEAAEALASFFLARASAAFSLIPIFLPIVTRALESSS